MREKPAAPPTMGGSVVVLRRLAPALLALVLVQIQAPCPSAGKGWSCYDPLPGHPTAEERAAFVREVSVYAREAEDLYGVPARGLVALSSYESGFGWTRTALFANNIFGYKHHPGEPPRVYVLPGQPTSDPNDRYQAFESRRACVLFVAERLARRPRYHGAAALYRLDLAAGLLPEEAADAWISRIAAAGYNPEGESYAARVRKLFYRHVAPVLTLASAGAPPTGPPSPPRVGAAAE